MSEPSIAVLGGSSPMQIAGRYLLATRPKFFTASVLPMLVGSAWGWAEGNAFDTTAFILGLLATVFVHSAANVLNDVFDGLNGNDDNNQGHIFPYTGGSRFIQNGVLNIQQMTRWGILLLVLGIAAGLALTLYKGPMIIVFGLIGIALGVLYSAPPLHLSAHGLGEAAVGVAFGTLPVVGATWLQTGDISTSALILSLPISMWVAAVLVINEVPDAKADSSVERKTLVVRFGPNGARWMYIALHVLAFSGFVLATTSGLLPVWSLSFPALMVIGAFKASRSIVVDFENRIEDLQKGIEITLGLHMLGCLWLLVLVTGTGLWW
jgi:1,4-dihydroxy-2-naphthoate polyprenyltransferase